MNLRRLLLARFSPPPETENHEGIIRRLDEHEEKLDEHDKRLRRIEHIRRERELFDRRRQEGAT